MNKGIALSKGNWLCFLGADDRLINSLVLEKIATELKPNIDVVSGKIQYHFTESDSRQIKKSKGVFSSSWTWRLWIKNTVHHQATFYQRRLFLNRQFDTSYNVLADYEFNLVLFKSRKKVKVISNIIAFCSSGGISKNYNWSLYQEEIRLKTKTSTKLLWPFFYIIAFLKFLYKKT